MKSSHGPRALKNIISSQLSIQCRSVNIAKSAQLVSLALPVLRSSLHHLLTLSVQITAGGAPIKASTVHVALSFETEGVIHQRLLLDSFSFEHMLCTMVQSPSEHNSYLQLPAYNSMGFKIIKIIISKNS